MSGTVYLVILFKKAAGNPVGVFFVWKEFALLWSEKVSLTCQSHKHSNPPTAVSHLNNSKKWSFLLNIFTLMH